MLSSVRSLPPALASLSLCASLCAIAAAAATFAGCDDPPPDPGRCASSADCAAGEACVDGRCSALPDAGPFDGGGMDGGAPDAGPECVRNEDCPGGACVDGACCAAADVCGRSCCVGGETCFANACVVAGAPCRSSADCGPGEYCEPGLGDEPAGRDAGTPDGGTHACLGAAPAAGRCVELPPRCEGDPAPGESCIRDCEYRPEAGRLNAVVQWSWGLGGVREYPGMIDVWATPAVGRLTDTNCDGVVDDFDPPNVVFVSGDSRGTCCSCGAGNETTCKQGVLRVLDGRTGEEVWSLRRPEAGSLGFAGLSVALGDLNHDGQMEIVTVSGEGKIVIVDHEGTILGVSADAIDPTWLSNNTTGWGGGLSIGDMDRDGSPEIAYGRVVFTTVWSAGSVEINLLWRGTGDWGRAITQAISEFANLDDDPALELLAGRTAYEGDGSIRWNRTDLPAGFSAPADFNGDGLPEVVHIANARVYLLNGADGTDFATSLAAAGTSPGNGGPPTIADFDGDGEPEIGVAWRQFYEVIELDSETGALRQLWASENHDLSSSVTGSTVFDFEGDGAAEVIYNDECFLWVYDGRDGAVRFAGLTSSFTATEASLVADIDADGSAEVVMIANSASPVAWGCTAAPWTSPELDGEGNVIRPGWVGSDGAQAPYRGIVAFRDASNSWVGTRTLWNQHAYSVSNICGDHGACGDGASYGDIPIDRRANWTVPFLNNFRQNIQGEGIFDAPDATVGIAIECTPSGFALTASVRNLGAALLTEGVEVGFFVADAGAGERLLGTASTPSALFPGQVSELSLTVSDGVTEDDVFFARILIDPSMRTFVECREDNNESEHISPICLR